MNIHPDLQLIFATVIAAFLVNKRGPNWHENNRFTTKNALNLVTMKTDLATCFYSKPCKLFRGVFSRRSLNQWLIERNPQRVIQILRYGIKNWFWSNLANVEKEEKKTLLVKAFWDFVKNVGERKVHKSKGRTLFVVYV